MSNREYVIPVLEYLTMGYSFDSADDIPSQPKVKTVSRKHYIITKQVNHIHKKINEVHRRNFKPTAIVISQLDYEFINAYFRYNPNFFVALAASAVRGEYSLFGLKVIISNIKHPLICWEPR